MPKKSAPSSVRGKVAAQNISPKGDVEGVLVETSQGLAQLNFPKHGSGSLIEQAKLGATIDIAASLEQDDEGDHPVYIASDASADATGTVVRFNYARHGEINGYHLNDGTFVHVKPDGAKRYKIRLGDRITVEGERKVGSAATVIDAKHLTKTGERARS